LRSTATQGAAHQADKKKLERLEALVRRLAEIARVRADKSNGKRLRARRHQLDLARESAAGAPDLGPSAPRIAFGNDASSSRIAVELRGYSKRFGDRVILNRTGMLIEAGQRVALVGQNGSGKSTLLKDIAASVTALDPGYDGEIRVGPSQRIAYCSQRHEALRPDKTVFEEVEDRGLKRHQAIPFLAAYRFAVLELDKPVRQLSGGERAMLQFACALLEKPNLLILDEPSNHLDIPAREALEEALDDFQGTVIIVSHDRYLLERVAGRVLWINGQTLCDFDGDYDDFWEENMADQPLRLVASAGGKTAADNAVTALEKRGRGKPHETAAKNDKTQAHNSQSPAFSAKIRETQETEKRIVALEAEQKQLEKRIAEANRSRDYGLARQLSTDLSKLLQRIEELYARWS
jgi:ATP-binding cassette subfamily F protein 3